MHGQLREVFTWATGLWIDSLPEPAAWFLSADEAGMPISNVAIRAKLRDAIISFNPTRVINATFLPLDFTASAPPFFSRELLTLMQSGHL